MNDISKAGRARASASDLTVVGLGASAGGLDPIQEFFKSAPAAANVSYVLIQHLSPDFKSMMADLLARTTALPIVEVEDGMPIEASTLYLAPRSYNVSVHDGSLRLHEQDRSVLNLPVDIFLESLAKDYGRRAVAVILSGTGSDGTRGVRSIYEHGGVVLVQHPDTAQFDGMPTSAIATDVADQILGPEDLARCIGDIASGADRAVDTRDSPSFLERVIALLRQDGGMDFAHYKESTLVRRIDRRMTVVGATSPDRYLELLEDSLQERAALTSDALIAVTRFFRDPEVWTALRDDVVRPLVACEQDEIRIWVSACSTGEEVYSLGMLLLEELDAAGLRTPVRLFATDVDPKSLEKGNAGRYAEGLLAGVSAERVRRFFVRESQGFQVRRRLREILIFAQHNLANDAPLTRMDLAICRNALIYMKPSLQQQVLATLHYSLKPGGHLVLGTAEDLGELDSHFRTVSRPLKIFEKIRDEPLNLIRTKVPALPVRKKIPKKEEAVLAESLLETAFESFLKDSESACLIVDRDGVLRHVIGDASKYLRPLRGRIETAVKDLLRSELSVPVITAMLRAQRERQPVSYSGMRCEGPEPFAVDVTVACDNSSTLEPDLFTVLLRATTLRKFDTEELSVDDELALRVADTERELQLTRQNLQATIEELETTNEEQQATNEELLASNEELQSTNEELHSVNEELYTVNAEYQRSIQELTSLNEDTENLIRSTGVGTIFLDDEGRIRKLTPAVTEVIPLAAQDIGRPLLDFSHRFSRADLLESLIEEGAHDELAELEVSTGDGRIFIVRRSPFLRDGVRDGVVLTFVDVTSRREQEAEAAQLGARLQGFLDASPMSMSVIDDQLRYQIISGATPDLLGVGEEILGQTASAALGELGEKVDAWRREILENGEARTDEVDSPTGRRVSLTHFRIDRPDGGSEIGLFGADVTERYQLEERERAGRNLLRTVLDQSPAALALVDSQGLVSTANPAAKALGLDEGVFVEDFFGNGDWANRDGERLMDSPLEGLLAGRAKLWEGSLRRYENGELSQFLDVRARSLARAAGVVLVLADTTQIALTRRQLDRERAWLVAMMRASEEPIFIVDDNDRVVLTNDAGRRTGGLDVGMGLYEGSFQHLSDDGSPLDAGSYPVALARKNGSSVRVRGTIRIADGTLRRYLLSATPVTIGDAKGMVAQGVDITEIEDARRRAVEQRQALEEAQRDLARRNQLLEDFSSVISHDLQEPLRTIINYSRLLERELQGADGEARELLGFLSGAAQRTKSMIRDLLAYSRSGRDHTGMASPADAIEYVIRQLDGLIAETGAEIEVGDLPASVLLDRGALRSIFSNLITNSLRYSEAVPRITIRSEPHSESEGRLARFVVTDNGVGVPEDQFERVFLPFHRLHSRSEHDGSGVGLSICRRILEMHGGSIHLEPAERGARVVFDVPLDSAGAHP